MSKVLFAQVGLFCWLGTAQAAHAGVLREVWTNVPGSAVADLVNSPHFPSSPVLRTIEPDLRSPVNWRDSYGVRLRAFLTPAASEDYTFWISGDETCELWLSTGADPANRALIARVPSRTGDQVWTAHAVQQSAPVALVAGERYYIEALLKESGGADGLAVAWATSPSAPPVLIPADRLTPFETPATPPAGLIVQAGQDIQQHAPNFRVDLSAQTLDPASPTRSATVVWSQVSGATSLIRTPNAANTQVDLPGIGNYVFRATASTSNGLATDEVAVTILAKLAPDAGSALTEYWLGIEGKTVASLTASSDYPAFPHARRVVTSLTAPEGVADQYGDRTRGFLLVPKSGFYRFFLAANESAEFFLSPDDSPANLRSLATITGQQISSGQLTSLGQPTETVELLVGKRYAFQILHKEEWGSDSCSLMWQPPGSSYVEEITTEFLAPPAGVSAALTASQELKLDADFLLNAGRDRIIYLPQKSLSLSAYEQKRSYASEVRLRTWSLVSGPGAVVFSAPGAAQTVATFPAAGTYVLRYSVQTINNTTAADEIRVEVKPALSAATGSFTRQVWWKRSFSTMDAFRADPAFPNFPDITDRIAELRQTSDWADLYATRVTGLLRIPAGTQTPVNYRFAVSGDDAAEFSISTDATAAGLRKICYTTKPSGRDNWKNEASQISAPIALKPGGVYFVELLHRETWSSDYFSIAWAREGDNLFQPIDGSFAEPTQSAPAFSAGLNSYANAGRDRTYWWPHSRTLLQGTVVRLRETGVPPVYSWRKVSGPNTTLSNTNTLNPEVVFTAAGTHTFELTVTEGSISHRDSVNVTIKSAQTGVSGYLTRSVWLDVEGLTPADLRKIDPNLAFPHFEDLLPGVEPPANWVDYMATRLKGSLTVPVAGKYTFWIVSDDASELKLDLKDGAGLVKIAGSEHAESPLQFDYHSWQKSAALDLKAGVTYPLEAIYKEQNGNDHLAVALEGPATNGREILSRGFLNHYRSAPYFNAELTVGLGVDRTLLWPENRITLAALVYDLKPGPKALTYSWSSPASRVVFDSPTAPVSGVKFPGPGSYEIRMTAGDGSNSGSDSVLVTVRNPLTSSSGGILREAWTGMSGYGLNDLKNATAYTSKPANFRDLLSQFEAPGNWGENYGQRLTGLFSVPVEGDYVFFIASDDESELLFNPTGETASGATRVAHCPWAVGRYNWTSRSSQQSQAFHLLPGKRYYIQALHKEGGGDDYLAVAYRRAEESNDKAVVIPGVLLSPPAGTSVQAFDGQMSVEAGANINTVWPKSRLGLQGMAIDYVPGPQPLAFRWSVLSAPKSMASRVVFAAPTALQTDVDFPAAGQYVLQLTATDGLVSRSDPLTVTIGAALAADAGSLLCETFKNISGYWVTDLTRNSRFPNSPDERVRLPAAESRPNAGDNYGLLIRGWLLPPTTGVYRFNISSDEWGEAFLSTDQTPDNKELICFSPSAVNYYEWRRFPDYQLSRPVPLQAGRRYYLEMRLKEGGWNDHVALAWLRPGTNSFEVIDGPYLAPWKLADTQVPVVSLKGDSAVTIEVGGTYVDPGFSASDGMDGDLTQRVTTEGTVDVTTPGTYTLRYRVSDAAGNPSATLTRTVTVALAPNQAPVYPADTSGTHSTAPWTPPATISDADAARFLCQASFGPTDAGIARVKAIGFSAWIDEQLALPATSHLENMDRIARYQGARSQLMTLARTASNLSLLPGTLMPTSSSSLHTQDRLSAWWTIAATAPDQLRQRIAFALSEILVISDRSGALQNYPRGVANYYDLLVKHSNGNYRSLLEQVTLNPMMGVWLTMIRSSKAQPDENYAREIMQLFSIGLEHLNRDGTFKRDANGNAIPTYGQTEINELARAFTGWTYAGSTSFTWTSTVDQINPLIAFEEYHDRGRKVLLGGASLSAGQTARQDVLRSLDVIFAHPNVGPFLSKLLIKRLVTSNPSPAYVYRVASKFENNGKGVRGDIGATVKAILLDPEARNNAGSPESGKLSEPILRLTRILRALGKAPVANPPVLGRYPLSDVGDDFNQSPFQSPTVFNFFHPDYQLPGPIQDAGLTSPEFEITTELSVVDTANYFFDSTHYGFPTSTGPRVELDFSALEALWSTPDALYTRIQKLLLSRPMSSDLRAALERVRAAYTNPAEGVRAMIQILASTPEFTVDR